MKIEITLSSKFTEISDQNDYKMNIEITLHEVILI